MTTAEQRTRALQRANEVRTFRRVLKQGIKAGEVTLEQVLRDPAPDLSSMPLEALLKPVPKLGGVKITRALKRAKLTPRRMIGTLTPDDRRRLLVAVKEVTPDGTPVA